MAKAFCAEKLQSRFVKIKISESMVGPYWEIGGELMHKSE